jgi:hypothetical protein
MRKIVLSIVALALPLAVFAQFPQILGDPVDYSRIHLPRDAGSYPVTYTMSFEHHTSEDFFYDMMVYWMTGDKSQAEKDNIGWTDVVFTGELRHTRDISPEMLEQAIQEAFLKTGLNRPLLKQRMEQSKELREIIYTNKEFLMDVAGAVMLAVPGLGEISAGTQLAINSAGLGLAVVSMAHDNSDKITNAVNSASATMSAAQSADNVLTLLNQSKIFVDLNAKVATGVGVGVNAAAMGLSTIAAHKREVQKWKNREGASALWQINSFYNWVNYYLDRDSKQAGKDAWVLLINSTSESAPYMFRNTMCGVTWALDAKLVKCESMPRRPDRLNYGFEGKYCGMLEAVSLYDLSGYSKQFLTKWGNWADDYLLQGKGFKAHGMMGSGTSTLGGKELQGDAMFHANWCYNDPMEEGARLYSHTANASMAGVYHIPVFFEIQLTGEAEGTFNREFVHLMWMNQDEFDGVGIARSFGFTETNPDQMYKTALKMETSMSGLITPRMGQFPAHTIKISEVVDGDNFIYDKVEKEKETTEVHEVFPLRNEHGFIDIALPEGELKIDFGNVLAPTFEVVPQDKKDWEKIKAKWF